MTLSQQNKSAIPARELFNRHGLRCTRQRLALYEVLRGCTSHPTADELYRMVQLYEPGVSRATVYNTLDALCTASLARQIPIAHGCCRYDADTSEHLHVQLGGTSEIRDVPADLGQQLMSQLRQDVLKQIERRLNVRINGLNIQLFGLSGE